VTGKPSSYGWVVLGAAFFIITMAIGTLFTLGIFQQPLETSMGWTRSSIGAISLLSWLVMGVGSFAAGFLSDRFGVRVVVLTGGVLLAAGLFLSSRVTELWQFYVTFGVLVGAGVSCFYVPLTVTAMRWFETRRGMAAAVVSSGNGLGILALSPLARWLINAYDWRTALVLVAELSALVVIPAAFLLRDPDRSPTEDGDADPAGTQSVFTRWPFWAIVFTHFGCCTAHSGPIFHMVSHAIDQGVPAMAAAGALGISGLTSILGRVGTGLVADRVGVKRTLLVALALQASVIFLYLFARDQDTVYGLASIFGVAYGGAMPLYAVVTREYFGERGVGTAYGFIFFISCIGMGLGSYAGGTIHDTLGSYAWLFIGSGLIGGMAFVLATTLRRPSRAVRPA
jgi:predicted MFS family arabinose efflux permease